MTTILYFFWDGFGDAAGPPPGGITGILGEVGNDGGFAGRVESPGGFGGEVAPAGGFSGKFESGSIGSP